MRIALVGAVLAPGSPAGDAHLLHQPVHGLAVQGEVSLGLEGMGQAVIPVAAPVALPGLQDALFGGGVLVRASGKLLLVVKRLDAEAG